MTRGPIKQDKPKFEQWRDRLFSVLVPLFLGYLLIAEQASAELKTIIVVLLVGFATGQAATFLRGVARAIGAGILESTDAKQGKLDKNDKTDQADN